ncbi:MAG: hypothetical protein ABIG66_05425 [Candidatus Kerfeldbacteria bacterium]
MKRVYNLLTIIGFVVGASLCSVLPARAEGVESYDFFFGEWAESFWSYYGGCENDDNTRCIDADNGNTFFRVGEQGVYQGMAQQQGPKVNDTRGKFVLKYKYKVETEEPADSRDDYGFIEIRDTESGGAHYRKVFYPGDAVGGWTSIKVRLPVFLASKPLRLNVEMRNNVGEPTVLYMDSISVKRRFPPRINGTVYETASEKAFPMSGVKVHLKNWKKTKILMTTYTDANGYYEFYPVKKDRRYRVVAKSTPRRVARKIGKKIRFGQTRIKDIYFK